MRRTAVTAVVIGLAMATAAVSEQYPGQVGPGEKTACERRIEELVRHYERYGPPPQFEGSFPPIPRIEYENSLISFRICIVKKGLTPEQEEARKKSWKCCDPEFYDVQLVRLDAYMRLCREAPVLNELGFRELRFTIERWELFGHVDLFDADIVFSATPGVVQPKSLAFATESPLPEKCRETKGSVTEGGISQLDECSRYADPAGFAKLAASTGYRDFPAMIIYNAIYDVWLTSEKGSRKVISQEPGVAMARGVRQIPPQDVTVAFQKPLETTFEGRIVKICPGTCAGMVEIPEHVFWEGIGLADRLKTGTAHLSDDWRPAAEKRKPARP